jgi:hypothetical protein
MCDEGFGPSIAALLPPARVESGKRNTVKGAERCRRQKGKRSDIREIGGGIGLLDEAPKDVLRRNEKAVIPEVVPADVHEPDKAALPAARNRKCATKPVAVELPVVLLAGELPLALPAGGLDEPRFQMRKARAIFMRADCVVSWHNPPLLEIVAHPVVLRVRNIFCLPAIS